MDNRDKLLFWICIMKVFIKVNSFLFIERYRKLFWGRVLVGKGDLIFFKWEWRRWLLRCFKKIFVKGRLRVLIEMLNGEEFDYVWKKRSFFLK